MTYNTSCQSHVLPQLGTSSFQFLLEIPLLDTKIILLLSQPFYSAFYVAFAARGAQKRILGCKNPENRVLTSLLSFIIHCVFSLVFQKICLSSLNRQTDNFIYGENKTRSRYIINQSFYHQSIILSSSKFCF